MIGWDMIFESASVTARGHKKIMRILNRRVMQKHAKNNLKKHFMSVPETSPGGGGYRYKRRGRKYTDDKRQKEGHAKPNVMKGDLRDAVLAKVRITATADKGTMFTSGSREHAMWGYQRGEIEAVSKKEYRALLRWQQRQYIRMANMPEFKRKRRKVLR